MSYAHLEADRGPLRPVLPVTDNDQQALQTALRAAGRLAVGSLMVAVYRVARNLIDQARERGDWPTLASLLVAGREGSWESEALRLLAWELGSRLTDKPRRYDTAAVDQITRIITGWITDPDRFTEVAETLAHQIGTLADQAGGWPAIADRYLRPGTAIGQDPVLIERLQSYLLSTAAIYGLTVAPRDVVGGER
jgi:hypothetical protein